MAKTAESEVLELSKVGPDGNILSLHSIMSEKNEYYIDQWKSEQHKNFMEGFYKKNISIKNPNAFDLSVGQEGNIVRQKKYSECANLMETFDKEFGGLKKNPHVIAMQVVIFGISDLDPVLGSFQASGAVHFRWYEPKFWNKMVYKPGTSVSAELIPSAQGIADTLWCPNASELEKKPSDVVWIQHFEYWPDACAHYTVEFSGTFMENFELNQFPFDVQDLSLYFKLDVVPGNFRYGSICIPDSQYNEKDDSRSIQVWKYGISDVVLAEWYIHEPTVVFGNGEFAKTRDDPMAAVYSIKIKLRRKSEGWLKNVILLLWLICSCAFAAFSLDPKDLGDRFGIVLTLLLTATAFKFVVSDSLPKVTYMTVLDKYVSYCNLVLILFVLYFSTVPHLDFVHDIFDDDVHRAELTIFLPMAAAIWILFNLVFLYRVWRVNKLHKAERGRPMREMFHVAAGGYRVL